MCKEGTCTYVDSLTASCSKLCIVKYCRKYRHNNLMLKVKNSRLM